MNALDINGLSCAYKNENKQQTKILDDLNLTLARNEIVCLLGESGCGKTTLLKAVAGLVKNLTGEIKINERTVNSSVIGCNIAPEKRKVGLIFQDYALFPHLNVFENIAFSLSSMPKQQVKEKVAMLLSLVKLSEFSARYPHQLSGGQQQRVAIARALIYEPDLMLLDEPFSNLDHNVRFELIREIRKLLKQQSMSALFVTHSKEEGFAFADKIALMQAGKIVQMGSAKDLYRRPNSKYVANFMGEANYIDAVLTDPFTIEHLFGSSKSRQKIDKQIKEPINKPLQMLLRPEHITINHDPLGKGRVEAVSFLGAMQTVTVRYGDQLFFVRQSMTGFDDDFAINDLVTLSVSAHDFVLFTD